MAWYCLNVPANVNIFSWLFRANEIFLVLFVTGVLHVACFTSSLVFLVFLALKTSDLARFPQKDSKASFNIFIHGDGPLF